jgi:hypothetical protein
VINVAGESYKLANVYLGDFNHLLNEQRQLVGFELSYWKIALPELIAKPLVSGTTNAVLREGGDLQFLLKEDGDHISDLSQAVGTELFVGLDDVVICFPEVLEWKAWESVAFEWVRATSVDLTYT